MTVVFQSHAGSIYLGNIKWIILIPSVVLWFQSHAGSIYLGNKNGSTDCNVTNSAKFQSHAGSIYLGNKTGSGEMFLPTLSFNPTLVRSTSATGFQRSWEQPKVSFQSHAGSIYLGN